MPPSPAELGLTNRTRVILYVNDFDQALAFYEDALELRTSYPVGGGWAEFAMDGGCSLCLHAGRPSDATTLKLVTFGWAVQDLEAAVAALRAKGVEVEDPHPVGDALRAASFHDPSGNALFFEGP